MEMVSRSEWLDKEKADAKEQALTERGLHVERSWFMGYHVVKGFRVEQEFQG